SEPKPRITPIKTSTERRRLAHNYSLLWVDANIDENNNDCQNTLTRLRAVVNDVNLCTQPTDSIQFFNTIGDEKAFVITSGSLGQHLVPDIHDIPNLNSIYIFCGDKSRHEQWTKQWIKIKGVHTDIKYICEALQTDVKQCNQDLTSISFVGSTEGTNSENLNQLDPTFMYTQIFKDILLEMKHDQKAIQDLTEHCRALYIENKHELDIIKEFERTYRAEQAIWWYTRQCFTFQMLNRALRNLESDTIIKMGFFMCDLHKQIAELHQQQIDSHGRDSFLVYRGQGLSKTDFEKLVKVKNGLLSFNNFLSTSKKQEVSLGFAESALNNPNTVGILFVISIDPRVTKVPFACVDTVSYFKTEAEVLFSMHTVFRVHSIKQLQKTSGLYQVDLQLTDDDDEQLQILTQRIRTEATGDTGLKRLGNLLLKIGHFNQAEELYKALLDQTCDMNDKGLYYHQLGSVYDHQGDYKKAVEYYDKALEIREKTLPSNHPSLATSYTKKPALKGACGHLSLMDCSSDNSMKPLSNTILERFYSQILPKIHHKTQWFNVEMSSMKRILLSRTYPNLSGLDNNVLNNLFKKQIISLCISFKRKQRSTDAENRIIFEDIMTVFTNLQYFRLNYSINAPYMSFITSPPTFVPPTLLELHINVENFNDCLYLLDGRFKQLQSLHINTSCIFRTIRLIINNTESLPNLKCLSLCSGVATPAYQQLIVPLLNRMFNLEKLHLHLIVYGMNSFIDGNNLNANIINHMLQLKKFTFNIRSDIRLHDQTNLLSNEDIQCTFNDFIDNEIITSVDYFLEIERANNFPGGIFKYVRKIELFDTRPFQHNFFFRISQSFPFVKELTVINEKAQYDKRSSTSNDNNEHLPIIEYPHLTKLDLIEGHHDYIEQFLLDTKTCLPNDVYLMSIIIAFLDWDPAYVAKWTLKFENVQKKLTNEQLDYLREYYTTNNVPSLDELEAVAIQWNIDDPYFVYDLDNWFYGRHLAELVAARRRYEARITGA
ncbi:hypothetical protein I4U23_014176, partial [Adineta vaga]